MFVAVTNIAFPTSGVNLHNNLSTGCTICQALKHSCNILEIYAVLQLRKVCVDCETNSNEDFDRRMKYNLFLSK